MQGIEQALLDFILQVFSVLSWPGVVVMMAIESASIPLPSEIVMPLAGWMLVKAQGLSAWYVLLAGFFGALGCTIGSLVAYWVGAKGGRPLVERYGKYILLDEHDLDRAERWFNKYGDLAVFVSRLLPVVRTFISLPVGVAGMNLTKFITYTFAGSFIWSAALAYGGYLLGEHWESLRDTMRPFDIPIIVIVVALAAFWFWRRLKHRKRVH